MILATTAVLLTRCSCSCGCWSSVSAMSVATATAATWRSPTADTWRHVLITREPVVAAAVASVTRMRPVTIVRLVRAAPVRLRLMRVAVVVVIVAVVARVRCSTHHSVLVHSLPLDRLLKAEKSHTEQRNCNIHILSGSAHRDKAHLLPFDCMHVRMNL